MQLNLIIYLFYYFFIVSSCLNKFLIRNDQQKKKYIYILLKHHKNNSEGNLIISVFLIFSLSFLNVKRSYFTKKKHLLVLIHCQLRNPQVIVIQKIKHLCNFCFNTCLTVFVVLNSLRLLRHLWLHRDNYIVLINQGNKLRYKVNNMF